jgi:LPS export ABC transporter protein LptC
MRTRTRARLAVLAALLLLLGAGAWLLARNAVARRRAAFEQAAVELLPHVAQRIQNFHRVKIEDGRKVWEVSAREAQYLDDEGVVRVEAPLVAVYLENGRTVSLRGDAGTVHLDDRELRSVELNGAIAVELGEFAFETDSARYEAASDTIVAPGPVRIKGTQFEIVGERMEVRVGEQHLTVSRNVEMNLWPDADGEGKRS